MFDAGSGVRASDVRDIDERFRVLVNELDPDAVPLCEALGLWEAFDAVERRASAAKVLLARRVEEASAWQRSGFRSAAEQLAGVAGTSVGAAKAMLETSKQVNRLPATAKALRKGRLSPAKAQAIAAAATVAPHAERELLASAPKAPLGKVREDCLRARAGVDRDKAHARIRKERYLREYTDAEPAKAKAKPTPARHLAIIRIDHTALRRGFVEGDELCEIAGLGPIPVWVARELLGDAILKLVITNGVDVINVTHLGRSATVAQQVALWWQSPGCEVADCTRTFRIENDHHEDWADTHTTRLRKLKRLCEHHHDLKTHDGWALLDGDGPQPMVPPDDPRHPNYRPPKRE